jgi:hypothetical protein
MKDKNLPQIMTNESSIQYHLEEQFFDNLKEILEEQFPKGERCQCGRKLPCRSKAIVLNAYANLLFRKLKENKKGLQN